MPKINQFQLEVNNSWAILRARHGSAYPIWIDGEGILWWWFQAEQRWWPCDMAAPGDWIEVVLSGPGCCAEDDPYIEVNRLMAETNVEDDCA